MAELLPGTKEPRWGRTFTTPDGVSRPYWPNMCRSGPAALRTTVEIGRERVMRPQREAFYSYYQAWSLAKAKAEKDCGAAGVPTLATFHHFPSVQHAADPWTAEVDDDAWHRLLPKLEADLVKWTHDRAYVPQFSLLVEDMAHVDGPRDAQWGFRWRDGRGMLLASEVWDLTADVCCINCDADWVGPVEGWMGCSIRNFEKKATWSKKQRDLVVGVLGPPDADARLWSDAAGRTFTCPVCPSEAGLGRLSLKQVARRSRRSLLLAWLTSRVPSQIDHIFEKHADADIDPASVSVKDV